MLSDKDLLSILSHSSDACAVYDSANLNIRFVNQAMLEFFGKQRNLVGLTLEDALPELMDQPFLALLKKVWETGKSYTATDTEATLIVNGDAVTSYFDFTYRPIAGAEGKTVAILHTAKDVTNRRESARELHEKDLRLAESETDFKRLVEQAPVAILVFKGADMVINQVNQAMLEILGKDHSIIGMPLLKGLPEITGAPAVEQLFHVYSSGESSDGNEEPVPILTNGSVEVRYFNFSYRPLMDNGKIIGVMDIAVEVTAQVQARKRLEANERRLQAMLDTMAEGVVIVDKTGKPTYVNPMAQEILGTSEASFKSRAYNDDSWQNERIDGSPVLKDDHPMQVVMQKNISLFDQELAVIRPGKEKIFISVNAAPLVDDQDAVTGAILSFTDVTNRRKLLQQKEDFISVASHELKTPVTTLKAALQLLSRKPETHTPERLSNLLGQANRSLDKLSDLINSLLHSNRISMGRFPMHKTTFLVSDLISDCCQHVYASGSHKISIKGSTQVSIVADQRQIEQVLTNLVNNAVKYAPGSKEILISVQQVDLSVKIVVTDFGPGIAKDKLPQIFQRYFQVGQGGMESSGLGLGLFICAEIIEKHQGEIGVESTPGQGSSFWFTLPS